MPFGSTVSYENLAELAGFTGGGRGVGAALNTLILHGRRIPRWRVVPSEGPPHSEMQRELLTAEGQSACAFQGDQR